MQFQVELVSCLKGFVYNGLMGFLSRTIRACYESNKGWWNGAFFASPGIIAFFCKYCDREKGIETSGTWLVN